MQIIDCEQGSPEWFAARLGLPTASEFHTVMAKGKDGGASVTRKTYMRKLAGEILTGQPAENYSNGYMDRGKAMEDEARSFYGFTRAAELTRVGFIVNGPKGCSPDSLIGDKGGLEIKTAAAHIQIERLEKDQLPPEHKAQVQGNLWVTERAWWDFVSYWPGLPLLVVHVARDEAYIKQIAEAVDAFNAELNELIEKIRSYGQEPVKQKYGPADYLRAG